jgi:hypothetical protein
MFRALPSGGSVLVLLLVVALTTMATPARADDGASSPTSSASGSASGSSSSSSSSSSALPSSAAAPGWDWTFGGLPALALDADNGFLVGVVAQLYLHDPARTPPYRIGFNLGISVTTKLVQNHYLNVDWLGVGDLPLRLLLRVGWSQSLTQNYCGRGMTVTCDPAVAAAAAEAEGLQGDEKEDFIKKYYLHRFMNPWAQVQGRWALSPLPRRVEVFGGWRGSAWIPGTWADDDGDGDADISPYPGSLYGQEFPRGEAGFASLLQLGVMLDSRDNEPSPRRGVWLEASVRGATPAWGSTWTWGGANATAQVWAPIVDGPAPRRVTLATRAVADIIVGDAPLQELVRPGGFTDYLSFGGADMGRGVRVQRYVGDLKLFLQNELRWRFLEWEGLGQAFALSLNGFVDAGVVGTKLGDPRILDGNGPVGGGAALLFHWNENFIVNAAVATSALENWPTSVYITLGQAF